MATKLLILTVKFWILLICCMQGINAIAEQISSLNDITTGSMVVQTESNKAELLPLMDTQVDIEIRGLVARTRLTQFFENPSVDVIEATYYFPLPEDSAVDQLQMKIGDRIIKGEIKVKQEAKRIYQQAKAAGKKAALLEQSRANLFRTKVANIMPKEVIEVTLEYQHRVAFNAGQFSIRFPSTITPRYNPRPKELLSESFASKSSIWQAAPEQQVITSSVKKDSRPDHQLSINVTLDTGIEIAEIKSPYHAIASLKQALGKHEVRLQNYHVADQDFVLEWRLSEADTPRLAMFHEQDAEDNGQAYSLLMLMPPTQNNPVVMPREVTFIIDYSGSMEGTSMAQAKRALVQAIGQLDQQDRFNIVGFNHKTTSLFNGTVDVTGGSIGMAQSYVSQLEADGGTEMLPALAAALNEPVTHGYVRQIVFLTDGAVSNEDELFAMIAKDLDQARLFTIGIGSAPNSYFMRKAAEFGRGTYTYIGSVNEVALKMSTMLDQLRYPSMTNISVHWPDQVEAYPELLPDLYLGQPISLVVKRMNNDAQVLVNGQIGAMGWQSEVELSNAVTQTTRGIGVLWARSKITALMDKQIVNGPSKDIKQEVTDLALKHHLMSAYTSFVAVEQKISRPENKALKSKNIPNLLPKGSQQFAYPATSLDWQWQLLIGVMIMLIAVSMYCYQSLCWIKQIKRSKVA